MELIFNKTKAARAMNIKISFFNLNIFPVLLRFGWYFKKKDRYYFYSRHIEKALKILEKKDEFEETLNEYNETWEEYKAANAKKREERNFKTKGVTTDKQYQIMTNILNVVSKVFDIEKDLICSPTREQYVIDARHAFCYLAEQTELIQLKLIGEFVNRQDHTTVINAVKSVKNLIETNKKYKSKIKLCKSYLEYYDN